LPPILRSVALIVLPLALICVLLFYYFKHDDLAGLQRWLVCGIAGGGLGNLIDRIFRPQGVVDFLSFKFYGIFGYERWPTFNVADSAVVVSAILLAATTIAVDLRKAK
ncbi:MAG: signal peptidase II, partial [Spirochaetaceae bacterium]|nr:signal peptidase II [Spirochaetaceae bacterium]